jgi:hypothetical protein
MMDDDPTKRIISAKEKQGWAFGCFGVIGLAIGLIIWVANSQSQQQTYEPSQTTPAIQSPPAPSSADIGGLHYDIVTVRLEPSIGDASVGMSKKANGEFILVAVRVRNTGTSAAHVTDQDFHLKRADSIYDADPAGSMYVGSDNSFSFDTINPGISRTGTVVFDVPADTSPSKYQLVVFGNGSADSMELNLQ